MELTVRPEDLAATSAQLRAYAADLESARERFGRRTTTYAPALGVDASIAAFRSAKHTDEAVRTVEENLQELARALRLLAHVYADVDAGAVRAQPESSPRS
jgi:uncharacterized protein YukE